MLLTYADVARWLNVSPRTVRRWAASGALPALQDAGPLRFSRSVLDAWIETRTVRA